MSRFALLVLGGVLATHLAVFAASAQTENIDLTELTPSMESQLSEAKRLNQADSESPPQFELNKLLLPASDGEQRYEVQTGSRNGGGDGGPGRMVSLVRDPAAAAAGTWLDRARLTPNNLRRRSNERTAPASAQANYNNNNNNDRGASRDGLDLGQDSYPLMMLSQRGKPTPAEVATAAAQAWVRDTNRDYDDLSGPQLAHAARSPIDNQESAARKSLWTPNLLRDLLIAQEARARARYFDQLARIYERKRAVSTPDSNGANSLNRQAFNKNHRCNTDTTVGIKNPWYCHTAEFIGASQYGNGEGLPAWLLNG